MRIKLKSEDSRLKEGYRESNISTHTERERERKRGRMRGEEKDKEGLLDWDNPTRSRCELSTSFALHDTRHTTFSFYILQ